MLAYAGHIDGVASTFSKSSSLSYSKVGDRLDKLCFIGVINSFSYIVFKTIHVSPQMFQDITDSEENQSSEAPF